MKQASLYSESSKVWFFNLQSWLATRHPIHPGLFALWLVGLIGLPPAWYFGGEIALTGAVLFNVLTQTTLVLAILVQAWGLRRAALTALGVGVSTWAIEFVGTMSAFPFGAYAYSDKLQPQFGHVPWLIPLAWLMMLPSAWALAYQVTGSWRGPAFWGLSALAMTAWDLFLDPQMVKWGFWTWAEPGGYFGIPWSNFGGWLLAAALVTILARPAALPARPLLLIYSVVWVLQTLGQLFFWDLPGPALAGFLGMGGCLGLAYAAHRRIVR